MTGAARIPATVANALTEKQLQQQVLDFASSCGWVHYHTLDPRGSDPGWPDLVLCRPPRLLFVELKRESGRLTEPQQRWLHFLQACGVDARVWRPSDWPEIEATLNGGRDA